MKIFKLGTSLGFMITSMLLVQIPFGHASSLFAKPWCEHRLQSDPREIKAFIADTQLIRKFKARKTESVTDTPFWIGSNVAGYGRQAFEMLDKVFENERYQNIEPEMRARLISFFLVRIIRIPRPRNEVVSAATIWLKRSLNTWTDFSPSDIERIRQSYRIFLGRKSRWIDRPHRMGSESLQLAGDTALSFGVDWLWSSVAGTVIPGAEFVFFPVFTIGRQLYLRIERSIGIEDLANSTKQEIVALNQKFFELLGANLQPAEFNKRWIESLRKVTNPSGGETKSGIVFSMVDETCLFLEKFKNTDSTDNFNKRAVANLSFMSESLKVINPIDWPKVRDSYLRIRTAVRTLGVTDLTDHEQIKRAMRSVLEGWTSNAVARKIVAEIVDSEWNPQPLPADGN